MHCRTEGTSYLSPFQANPGALVETPENLRPTFFFEVFLSNEVIEFLLLKQIVNADKVCQNMVIKRSSHNHNSENGSQQMPHRNESVYRFSFAYGSYKSFPT